MTHPWFESIDWDMIKQMKVKAPFTPILSNDFGLNNFDPEFTNESIGSITKSVK